MSDDLWKVRVLSDTVLYQEAAAFVAEHQQLPNRSQLTGLAVFSRSWSDLTSFVNHQLNRNWSGSKDHYRQFYDDLKGYLLGQRRRAGLIQRVATEFGLVSEELSRNERRVLEERWAQMLAQEFIQHLIAESWGRAPQQ